MAPEHVAMQCSNDLLLERHVSGPCASMLPHGVMRTARSLRLDFCVTK